MACNGDSPRLVVLVVAVGLLLDSLLGTVVVPIAPMLLYSFEHPENTTGTLPSEPATTSHSAPLLGKKMPITPSSGPSLEPLFNNSNSSHCPEESGFLHNNNLKVGALLASKSIAELLVSSIVGPLTNRIGFRIPMFVGFLVFFASTLIFAFAGSFVLLVSARVVQGVGSSFTFVAGLGMLASVYTDDEERGQAMGMALGGLALGLICGGPFGSVMFEYVGKSSPFLILAGLALLYGVLQLCVLRPTQVPPVRAKGTPLFTLLRDPYILLTTGALTLSCMALMVQDATLPTWMIETMCASQLQLGLMFTPTYVVYFITTNLFGILSQRMGRWLCSMIGMILTGLSFLCAALAKSFYAVIGAVAVTGLSMGMMEVSLLPVLAHLVDIRHVSVYGNVFALCEATLRLGFFVGPLAGGALVQAVGYPILMVICGLLNILYAPLCYFLRNPPTREEKRPLVDRESGDGSCHTVKQ